MTGFVVTLCLCPSACIGAMDGIDVVVQLCQVSVTRRLDVCSKVMTLKHVSVQWTESMSFLTCAG